MLIYTILLVVGFLQLIQCRPEADIVFKEIEEPSIYSQFSDIESIIVPQQFTRTRYHRSTDQERHFDAFGENFDGYFEPADHVFMGNITKVILASSHYNGDGVNYKIDNSVLTKLKFANQKNPEHLRVDVEHESKSGEVHLEEILNRRIRSKSDDVRPDNKPSYGSTTVYPELFVAVDYTFFRFLNGNIPNIVKYVASFMVGVDLRFREVTDPHIRLSIAGILIATDANAAKFIQYDDFDLDVIRADLTADSIVKSDSFAEIPFKNYDIFMLLTKNRLFKEAAPGAGLHFTEGFSNQISACEFEGDRKRAIAIVQERQGLYTGITTAAHYLGHVLGVGYDEDSCSKSDSDMASLVDGSNGKLENRLYFSECNKKSLRTFLRSDSAQCLYNKPDVGVHILKPLPGMFFTMTEQCQALFEPRAVASRSGNESCQRLYCNTNPGTIHEREVSSYYPPAEGTSCEKGTDKICLNGACGPLPGVLKQNSYL